MRVPLITTTDQVLTCVQIKVGLERTQTRILKIQLVKLQRPGLRLAAASVKSRGFTAFLKTAPGGVWQLTSAAWWFKCHSAAG